MFVDYISSWKFSHTDHKLKTGFTKNYRLLRVKRTTVDVMSTKKVKRGMSDTMVPLKALPDQVWIRYPYFSLWKLVVFICGFSKACKPFSDRGLIK